MQGQRRRRLAVKRPAAQSRSANLQTTKRRKLVRAPAATGRFARAMYASARTALVAASR